MLLASGLCRLTPLKGVHLWNCSLWYNMPMTFKEKMMSLMTAASFVVVAANASETPFRIVVEPDVAVGIVKPVNGVGQPPMVGSLKNWPMMHYLKEAGIPYSRLHDVGGRLGGGLFVDIPNLFPDFDADDARNQRASGIPSMHSDCTGTDGAAGSAGSGNASSKRKRQQYFAASDTNRCRDSTSNSRSPISWGVCATTSFSRGKSSGCPLENASLQKARKASDSPYSISGSTVASSSAGE